MRIAVVTETWPPEVNGVALTVQHFVQQMQALGHDVELSRPTQPADRDAPERHDLQQHLVRGLRLPRYPDLQLGLPNASMFQRNWTTSRPSAVYVATEGPLGWSAVRTAKAMGIRVVTGFHTRFDDYVAHYGARLLSPIVLAWLRRFHNRADLTLVPTRELLDSLRAKGFSKVGHLPRAVDCERFHPRFRDAALRDSWGVKQSDLVVLHVGRLAAEKNLGLIVQSFDRIRQRLPEARMVWVGDGPACAELRSLHPDHIFCGVRRGEELSKHYASGDLFLFPSLTDTFGNVTLEAMASGLPVVAFNYAAAREHIHDGVSGRTVAFADDAAFVQAAELLAEDRSLRADMGLLARNALIDLDQRQVAQRLLDALSPRPIEEVA